MLVDGLLIYLQTIAVTWLVYRGAHLSMPPPQAPRLFDSLAVLGIMVLTAWLYFALTESSARQASLGKRVLRIMVIDAAGGRIAFGQATRRFWLKIFSLGWLLIPFSNRPAMPYLLSGILVIDRGSLNRQPAVSTGPL